MSINLPQDGDETTLQGTQAQDIHSVDRSPADFDAQASSTPSSNEASPPLRSKHASAQPAHQRFVFTDPVAFRFVTPKFFL